CRSARHYPRVARLPPLGGPAPPTGRCRRKTGLQSKAAFGSGTASGGSKPTSPIAGRFAASIAEPVYRRARRAVATPGQRRWAAVERGARQESRDGTAISGRLCLG